MTSTTDRILDVIDAGLQSSDEHGYGTDHLPGLCARCQCHEPGVGDLCTGCRSFLLDDSDEDPIGELHRPVLPPSELVIVAADVICPEHGAIGQARAMVQAGGDDTYATYRLHVNGLFYSGIGFPPDPPCPSCGASLTLDTRREHSLLYNPPVLTMSGPCVGFTALTEYERHYTCSRVRGRTVESHAHPRAQPGPEWDDEPSLSMRFEYSAS